MFPKFPGGIISRISSTVRGGGGGGVPTVFAQLSDSTTQDPSVTTPVPITFNTNDGLRGITHSETVDPSEITIDKAGTYVIMVQPQVGKTSGAQSIVFDSYLQRDTGSGFVDIPNTNIKLTIKDQDLTDVIVRICVLDLDVGDKIRFMQRASNSTVGLGLKATAAEVGPPTIPATPSVIFSMVRVDSVS